MKVSAIKNLDSLFPLNTPRSKIIMMVFFTIEAVLFSLLGTLPWETILALLGGSVVVYLILKIPELGMVMLFTVSIIKGWLSEYVPFFQHIDYTVFIASITFISIFFHTTYKGIAKGPSFAKLAIPLVLFAAFLLFSTLYTKTFDYGVRKALSFIAFNLFIFFGVIYLVKEKTNAKKLIYLLISFGILFALILHFQLLHHLLTRTLPPYVVRMTILSAPPIELGRIFAVSAILLISIFPTLRTKRYKVVGGIALFILMIALVATNSRGPFVSFLLALIIYVCIAPRGSQKQALIWLTGISLIIFTAFILLPHQLVGRYPMLFALKTTAPGYLTLTTTAVRLQYWATALKAAFSNLIAFFIGVGSGGFGSFIYPGYPQSLRFYPHNIFLEIFCDIGIVGLFLFLWHLSQISSIGSNLLRSEERLFVLPFIMGFTVTFFNAQVSGDLCDNRALWFFAGSLVAIYRMIEYQKGLGHNTHKIV